jgi:flagellar biosynthesis activator protein FlaF
MYQFSYLEIAEDSGDNARENERRAIRLSIDLFKQAADAGAGSMEKINAIYFAQKLWTVLVEDLARPENTIDSGLKAKLISICLWALKEIEQIRQEKSSSFDGLIAVSETICAGLK